MFIIFSFFGFCFFFLLFISYFLRPDPPPATRYPSPATRDPSTRHPLPVTRGKVLPMRMLSRWKIACSCAGVFFGRTNVLRAKARVETFAQAPTLTLTILLSLIVLRHNNDDAYNSTNINKQLSPSQNTPALQASWKKSISSSFSAV